MHKLVVTIILILTSANFAHGHGGGQSFEKVVGEYKIDVGLDALRNPVSGQTVRFDFNIWSKDGFNPVEFTSVWVRLAPEKGITFASYLAFPEFGLPAMSYVFPKSGPHELTVRFYKGDQVLAETAFPVTVEKGPAEQKVVSTSILVGLSGLVAGFLFGLSWARRKNSKA